MKIFFSILTILLLSATLLMSCDLGPASPRGFSLPAGDINAGKIVLLKYQCLACHQLKGTEQADIIDNPTLSVRLGGKSIRVTTYAELVTSIINPSHKFAKGYKSSTIQDDGKSKMKIFNDVMTVQELIDLVSFLQPHYELVPYRRTNYQFYGN